MKKNLPVFAYGVLIVFVGVYLFLSNEPSFETIKLVIGIASMSGAILAFIAAFSRERKAVQFAYHEMHALAMLVFGTSLIVFCDSYDKLVSFSAFLLIFYSFSEIIFCNWLFNLRNKFIYKIIALRLFLALATGIGTVIAINASSITLECFGILFILVGINVLFYVPVTDSRKIE